MRGCIQSAAQPSALSIVRACIVSSTRPQMGWGGIPLSGGPGTPSQPLNLNVATFNARRLWLSDHSVHDGFHMLVNLLRTRTVKFCASKRCLLLAGEAGFLFRNGVSRLAIPGVEDALSVRWRVHENSLCICSFHVLHAH